MSEPTVAVGKITKAHGLKGEVLVLVFSDNPDRFAVGSSVFLEDGRVGFTNFGEGIQVVDPYTAELHESLKQDVAEQAQTEAEQDQPPKVRV